ncbi:MAG: TonB family protein [Acidobacteria bacterium]|nr:TonB family protein [Acidobacteriota bacterium]
MNAAVAGERWRGWIIDRQFALLDWLGGSANTAVFRTELAGSNAQSAAIKLVRAGGATIAQQLSRWKQLAALPHPHILRIFDAGHCQILGARWLYIVTEYGDENLDPVLQVRALSLDEVREFVTPVLEALKFLHGRGLVHGRIKPSNIFAVKNQLKLSSDGIQSEGESPRFRTISAYDAPEAGSAVLSSSADIWSLGMMLVTAFNQRPVTWSRSSQLGPQVPKLLPPPYWRIAAECLHINPAERCSLERIGVLLRPPSPVPKLEEPLPPPPRRRSISPLWAVMVLAVLAIALIGWHARRGQKPAGGHPLPRPALTKPTTQPTMQPTTKPTSKPATEPATENTGGQAPGESLAPTASGPAEPGRIVHRVLPDIPLSARMTIEPSDGKVRVKVLVSVDENGDVASASFVSAGPSRYFARLALEASRKWKFRPATIGDKPAASRWLIEYRFGREATEVDPVESN